MSTKALQESLVRDSLSLGSTPFSGVIGLLVQTFCKSGPIEREQTVPRQKYTPLENKKTNQVVAVI